jgi:hypothetical protein
MNKPTPEEFRKLWWRDKINTLVFLYKYNCCTDFKYWPIRKHFENQDINTLHILYDFLYSIKQKKLMNLTEVYVEAEKYRQQQQLIAEKEKSKDIKIEKYDDYLDLIKEM